MTRIHPRVRVSVLTLSALLLASCSDSSTDVDPLSITTTGLPDGAAALEYEATLEAEGADGGPYSWELAPTSDPLPEGLELASDGTISGAPALNGTSTFTVVVSAGEMTDEAELSITVEPDCHIADCAGLEGYWRMDDASLADGDEVADGSGLGRTGTVVTDDPGDKRTTGQAGGAIGLDGTVDHVEVADDAGLDLDGDFTLTAWINADAVDGGFQAIISKNHSPRPASLWIEFAHVEVWFTPGGSHATSSSGVLDADTWHHLAATYDVTADEIRIYVDGVLDTTVADAGGPADLNDEPLTLGQRGDDSFYFTGALDELMVWSRALTGSEIDGLYDATN